MICCSLSTVGASEEACDEEDKFHHFRDNCCSFTDYMHSLSTNFCLWNNCRTLMRKNRMSSSISLHFESRLNFLFYGVYDLIQQIYTEIVIFKLNLGTATKKMKSLCFLFPFYSFVSGVIKTSLDAFCGMGKLHLLEGEKWRKKQKRWGYLQMTSGWLFKALLVHYIKTARILSTWNGSNYESPFLFTFQTIYYCFLDF